MNVLLVEDDAGIGRFVSQGLAVQGIAVRWERSGSRVPALVAGGGFNAVILDRRLPDCDGTELCAAIRAAECGVPILMLTARASLDDRLEGFAAGADDYLAKPFSFDELVARLMVLLRRDRTRRPDPVGQAGLRLDPATRTASWEGRALDLDPRSHALLVALARAGGAVVPRSALIEEIWGTEADISDNALDVCTSTARRRLAAVTNALTIRAVRGQGLALVPGAGRRT